MRTYLKPTRAGSWLALALFMLTGILLACGPAAQYNQEQARERAAQEEPTQEPACDRTEGNYPNLDEALGQVFTS